MAMEIERKFLVNYQLIPPAVSNLPADRFFQGYLAAKPTVRVRLAERDDEPARAWLTIKGPGSIARAEFEYPIPPEDARALLSLCQATLVKTRRRVAVGTQIWELDAFEGALDGLWLAEVELDDIDEPIQRPDWVTDEVTHDPAYGNGALARRAPGEFR